jgi:hypothetical protein
MTRVLSWCLLVLLFGGFGVVVWRELRARADAGKGMPAFSVYSRERDGLADAADTLRTWGWDPVAVTRPVQHTHDRGLLILVQPQVHSVMPGEAPDLGEADVHALLGWVEEGNTLLFCCDRLTNLHRQLKLGVTTDTAPEDLVSVDLGEAGPYTAGIDRLIVHGNSTVEGNVGLPLWWVGPEPGAVVVPRGKGRVLVVADPALLTLDGLRREDNCLFLYNVAALHAKDGRVYFDEYHHGLQSGGGFWGYLRHHHLQWTLLPILLVVAVGVWRVAVRLGPAVPTPRGAHADAVDYASAVAHIYHRAGARRLLARALARGFQAPLTRHLRLRRAALPAEVLAAWQQRYPDESARRLQRLLRGVAELRKGDVSDRQLLAWARAFDEFEKELARGEVRHAT